MYIVSSFYQFDPRPLDEVLLLKRTLTEQAQKLNLQGLLLIAPEGLNASVAGSRAAIQQYQSLVKSLYPRGDIIFKDNQVSFQPFRRLHVELREEIITLYSKNGVIDENLVPQGSGKHLSPEEWHQLLQEKNQGAEIVLLDTRNEYETRLGVFQGATDPKMKVFSEFPEYVKNCGIPKNSKVLMYCTGGIRCEKAALEMERQGFQEVYQLQGGILNYLEFFPEGSFEGECYVFDHRVAVDNHLQPSAKYHLCPHCGDPAANEIACHYCEEKAFLCDHCMRKAENQNACSKNCRHHLGRRQVSVEAGLSINASNSGA